MRVQIVESGGSSTPTTSGTAVALTTSYQQISAAVTLQGDSTGVSVRIQCSADGGSDVTIYVDSINVYAGSAVPNTAGCRMQKQDTDLICVTDRAVWKFSEDEDYWMLQKVHGAVITGLTLFDDRLLAGQGESTVYQYSDADDPTSWTASNLGGTLDNANRFGVTLNVNGNYAAVKTLNDDEVYLATNPLNGGTWGSAIEVGKDDHDILQLHDIDGTIAVGKEDGFYRYLSLNGNRFENVYPGAKAMVDSDNFSRGLAYNGAYYTAMAETGFVRYFPGQGWESLEHLIQSPGFDQFGNRVRAFGTDGEWLYLIVEDLNSDSISKECWLFALKEFRGGEWTVHTICTMVMSDAIDMMVHKPAGGNNRFLYINGDINDQPVAYRIQLPNRTNTPRLATNKDLALSGSVITPYMDWNRPQVLKAAARYAVISESLASGQTITVAYQVDNETAFTDINSNTSVFSSSPQQIVALNEGVNARRIRFRLTFATNDATKTPVLKGTNLDVTWRPPRLKRWTIIAGLEDRASGLQGVPSGIPAGRQLVRLQLLRDEISPLRITDIDGSLHRGHIIDMAETQYKVHPSEVALRYSRAVRLTLAQALTVTAEPWDSGARWGEFHWG